jgi:hypothetical protein
MSLKARDPRAEAHYSSSMQASSRPGDWSGARGCSANHLQQLLKQLPTTPLLPSPAQVSMTCAPTRTPQLESTCSATWSLRMLRQARGARAHPGNGDKEFGYRVLLPGAGVVEEVEELRRGEVFGEWGVDLCCERGSAALKVVRLFPSSRDSLWTFCDDTQKRGFYVPFDLLRVGDLSNSIKTTQLTSGIGARSRSRCAVDVIGGGSAGQQASCYYEVVGNKARKAISHRCRLGLDYIYPPAAPASSPSSASARCPLMH